MVNYNTTNSNLTSGICKEIYFRGFAKRFCGEVFGETAALLLFNKYVRP